MSVIESEIQAFELSTDTNPDVSYLSSLASGHGIHVFQKELKIRFDHITVWPREGFCGTQPFFFFFRCVAAMKLRMIKVFNEIVKN